MPVTYGTSISMNYFEPKGSCPPGTASNIDNHCMLPGSIAAPGSLNSMPFETARSQGLEAAQAVPRAAANEELLTPTARLLVNMRSINQSNWALKVPGST